MTQEMRRPAHQASEAFAAYHRFALGEFAVEMLSRTADPGPLAGDDAMACSLIEDAAGGPGIEETIRVLRASLEGRLDMKGLRRWVLERLCDGPVRSASEALPPRPAPATLLPLLALLTERAPSANPARRLCALQLVLEALSHDAPLPMGRILEDLVCGLDTVPLAAQVAPWPDNAPGAVQWLDFALEREGSSVELIPLSLFTRRFFREVLPAVASSPPAVDPFHYHRENDKAVDLVERHPRLRAVPFTFHYFVDASGLAEVVVDAPALGPEESVFAVRLFGLYNSLSRVTLDGATVSILQDA